MDLGALVCTRTSRPAQTAGQRRLHRAHAAPHRRTTGATSQKTLPERQVQMLLLFDRGELMLEKRPSRGIWGGLWSLPELAFDADPACTAATASVSPHSPSRRCRNSATASLI